MQETSEGTIVDVKVVPKASRSEVVGWEGGRLKVRIAAVPDKGAANKELVKVLAKRCGVARSSVEIVTGTTSRQKRVLLRGCQRDTVENLLESTD